MTTFITLVTRALGLKAHGRVRLGESASDHVEAHHEHRLDLWARDSLADVEAKRAAIATEWAELSSEARAAIITECDELDDDGLLDDHRYYSQWRQHRRACEREG